MLGCIAEVRIGGQDRERFNGTGLMGRINVG